MLENNTGTNGGNEVFNTLQSLNQQTVSTLLTLIKQSATELHNAVIAFTVGRTLLGYHGLSSSAPRDALCRLRLEINQSLTPPSSVGKKQGNPLFNKPTSRGKAPGYHNINNPATSVHV